MIRQTVEEFNNMCIALLISWDKKDWSAIESMTGKILVQFEKDGALTESESFTMYHILLNSKVRMEKFVKAQTYKDMLAYCRESTNDMEDCQNGEN